VRALLGYLCRHRAPCCAHERIRGCTCLCAALWTGRKAVRPANAIRTRVRAHVHARRYARTQAGRQAGKQAGGVTDWRLAHIPASWIIQASILIVVMTYRLLIAAQITPILHRARASLYFRRVCQYIPGCLRIPHSLPSTLFTRPLSLSSSRISSAYPLYLQADICRLPSRRSLSQSITGISVSERSKIDSAMPGVRLIGDTRAPITTRKPWSQR